MMPYDLLFDFPEESALDVIKQIKDGSFICGHIDAPLHLLSSKAAIGHTGFTIDRFNDIRPVIQTLSVREESKDFQRKRRDNEERKTEGWIAIIGKHKYPGFLHLNDAGYESRPIRFNDIQEIIQSYVQLGYKGVLHYYFGDLNRDGETWDTDLEITVFLEGTRGNKVSKHPFSVRLRSYTSKGDGLAELMLAYCKSSFGEPQTPQKR